MSVAESETKKKEAQLIRRILNKFCFFLSATQVLFWKHNLVKVFVQISHHTVTPTVPQRL